MYKKDFPIFENNPDLIYLDSTASSQKPKYVIDGIKNYLENNYSNIHRWMYQIAENSEKLYIDSKKKVAKIIWAKNFKEIIYTYNSTYALNLLASSIWISKQLKKWDKVLVSIVEHNANIVPWLILKEQIWIELVFINIDENYNLDLEDFKNKYDEKVKVISLTHVSNVTGQIFDLEKIGKLKREETIFIVDASQSIPHFKVDVDKINCDYLFFTWHKVMADSGIWILWWKKEKLEKLTPSFGWWGSVSSVSEEWFSYLPIPEKFESGTPNITWAVWLLKALEYIENIWWYEKIEEYENKLVKYFLEKLENFNYLSTEGFSPLKIIWSKKLKNRVWVFSLLLDWIHSNDIADLLSEKNIATRSWKHCAHSYFKNINISHSFRVSLYIYNNFEDIDNFFEALEEIYKKYN